MRRLVFGFARLPVQDLILLPGRHRAKGAGLGVSLPPFVIPFGRIRGLREMRAPALGLDAAGPVTRGAKGFAAVCVSVPKGALGARHSGTRRVTVPDWNERYTGDPMLLFASEPASVHDVEITAHADACAVRYGVGRHFWFLSALSPGGGGGRWRTFRNTNRRAWSTGPRLVSCSRDQGRG